MTRTTTSKAAGSGTSISSIWKASTGSPSRSWRITHAAIVSGSSPGSVATWATWVTSTATCQTPRLGSSGCGGMQHPPAQGPDFTGGRLLGTELPMPTEPAPLLLSDLVRQAVAICDPDGDDPALV